MDPVPEYYTASVLPEDASVTVSTSNDVDSSVQNASLTVSTSNDVNSSAQNLSNGNEWSNIVGTSSDSLHDVQSNLTTELSDSESSIIKNKCVSLIAEISTTAGIEQYPQDSETDKENATHEEVNETVDVMQNVEDHSVSTANYNDNVNNLSNVTYISPEHPNSFINFGNVSYSLPLTTQLGHQYFILQQTLSGGSNIVSLVPQQEKLDTLDEAAASVAHLQNIENQEGNADVGTVTQTTTFLETDGQSYLVTTDSEGNVQKINVYEKETEEQEEQVERGSVRKINPLEISVDKTKREILNELLEQTRKNVRQQKITKRVKQYKESHQSADIETFVDTVSESTCVKDQSASVNVVTITHCDDDIIGANPSEGETVDKPESSCHVLETGLTNDKIDNIGLGNMSEGQGEEICLIEDTTEHAVQKSRKITKGGESRKLHRSTKTKKKEEVNVIETTDTSDTNKVRRIKAYPNKQENEKEEGVEGISESWIDVDLEKLINITDSKDRYVVHLYPMLLLDVLPEKDKEIVVELEIDRVMDVTTFQKSEDGDNVKYCLTMRQPKEGSEDAELNKNQKSSETVNPRKSSRLAHKRKHLITMNQTMSKKQKVLRQTEKSVDNSFTDTCTKVMKTEDDEDCEDNIKTELDASSTNKSLVGVKDSECLADIKSEITEEDNVIYENTKTAETEMEMITDQNDTITENGEHLLQNPTAKRPRKGTRPKNKQPEKGMAEQKVKGYRVISDDTGS